MTTIVEDYSPLYVGDTQVSFAPVFQHKDGSAVNLLGATFGMKMVNEDVPVVTTKTCSGSWVIDDAANGKAHYQWQSADVNTPGTWTLYITITIGGLPVHPDPKIVEILAVP